MRIKPFIALGILLLLSSCWKPSDYDFDSDGTSLNPDEMIWVTRFPREGLETRSKASAFFHRYLPGLHQRLLKGEIPIYTDFSIEGGDGTGLFYQELLIAAGVPLNYAPKELAQVVQVYSIVQANASGMRMRPVYMQLIWKEPDTKLENVIGGVYLKDLIDVPFENEENVIGFLAKGDYAYLPMFLLSDEMEYQVPDARTAQYLLEQTAAGKWEQLSWIQGELNMSGRHPKVVSNESLLSVSGLYRFFRADSTVKDVVFMIVEGDHLVADWSSRLSREKVFPASEKEFFTLGGDSYHFVQSDTTVQLMYSPFDGMVQTAIHVEH